MATNTSNLSFLPSHLSSSNHISSLYSTRVQTEALPKALKPNEILIKILAAPINPADLNMVEGSYGIKPTLPAVAGNEGVGTVLEVGSSVRKLKANDLVVPTKPALGIDIL